jgi:malonyl-ACP decarboxylase
MGIVSSIGADVAAFTQALREGRSGVRRLAPRTGPAIPVDIGATIEGFTLEGALAADAGLPHATAQAALRAARRSPWPVQASLAAALQAWREARLDTAALPEERVAIVAAGHNTTQSLHFAADPAFREHPEYLSPRYALQHMDSHHVGVLSEALGVRGEGFVAGAASASGNVALIQGLRLIRAGAADACIVLGIAADPSPLELQAFHAVGAMGGKVFRDEPQRACRPFDARHEGFVFGQAAAAVVLESPASAAARGVRPSAHLLGGAIRMHATASTEPDAQGEAQAMRAALDDAGEDASRVDYVNTHGTSAPLGDRAEVEALSLVLGERLGDVWLNATKGFTGHCLHSAGVVELVACAAQMREGFLHPNANLEQPIDARARFCGARAESAAPRLALSNSFGFGGINTSIVVAPA